MALGHIDEKDNITPVAATHLIPALNPSVLVNGRATVGYYLVSQLDSRYAGAGTALLVANNLSDLSDAATARTNLGLGTIATQAANSVAITGGSISGITDLAVADGGTGAGTAAAARTNLGLVIGTNVQAQNAYLQNIAALTPGAGTDGHALTWDNGAGAFVLASLASLLPVEETTAIVYQTGDVTRTAKFDLSALTAARSYALPNVGTTLAGLGVAQTFTATQTFYNAGNPSIAINRASVVTSDVDFLSSGVFNSTGHGASASGQYGFTLQFTNALTASTRRALRVLDNTNTEVFGLSTDGTLVTMGTGLWFDFSKPFRFTLGGGTITSSVGGGKLILEPNITSGPPTEAVLITASNTSANVTALKLDSNVASTAAVVDALNITTRSGGTPLAGFGAAVRFGLESSTTPDQNAIRLLYEWATATHASRKARGKLTAYDTAERECIRFEASGTAAMIGFLGATAIARQAHIVDADGTLADITTKFNTLLSYIENFGFIATS